MTLKKKNRSNQSWMNMNWINMTMLILGMIGLITFTSCEKEDMDEEISQVEELTTTGDASFVTGGIMGLTQGGKDNDGDGQGDGVQGGEFEIQYPIDIVFPDGTTTTVNSDDELYTLIEDWFENNEPVSEIDLPTLVFPVSVTLEDGTVVTVNNEDELDELIETYFEDDYEDDYDDEGDFDDLAECFEIEFPVTVVLPDNSSNIVNSLEEVEVLLDDYYTTNPEEEEDPTCLLYTSPSPRDATLSRMPSSA